LRGRDFTLAPKGLEARYPKLQDFKKLVAQYDPHGKFRNAFLEREVYGG